MRVPGGALDRDQEGVLGTDIETSPQQRQFRLNTTTSRKQTAIRFQCGM